MSRCCFDCNALFIFKLLREILVFFIKKKYFPLLSNENLEQHSSNEATSLKICFSLFPCKAKYLMILTAAKCKIFQGEMQILFEKLLNK